MYLMNMFGLLLTTAFMFNSGLLIRIFFGEQWLNLKNLMLVVSCTLLFNVDGRLADCYLRSLAMTKQQFFFRIFEFVLKTLGVLLGYKGGIMGVALSILITNLIAKVVKIIYIGAKVDTKPNDVIRIVLSSWRYALILLPVSITSYIFLPQTLGGDIAMTVIYIATTGLIFLFMPSLVGKQYKEEVYVKVMSLVNNKLHKK